MAVSYLGLTVKASISLRAHAVKTARDINARGAISAVI